MSVAALRFKPAPPPAVVEPPALLLRMVNAVPDAMLVFDGLGCIRFANSAAARLLGTTAGALKGQRLVSLIDPDERAGVAAQCGEYFEVPYTAPLGSLKPWRLLRHDGTAVSAALGLSPARVNGRLLGIALLRAETAAP